MKNDFWKFEDVSDIIKQTYVKYITKFTTDAWKLENRNDEICLEMREMMIIAEE
jgi:hypothetical protein